MSEHNCLNCRHRAKRWFEEPCVSCYRSPSESYMWEPVVRLSAALEYAAQRAKERESK